MTIQAGKFRDGLAKCEPCQSRVDGYCSGLDRKLLEAISGHKLYDQLLKPGQDLFRAGESCDAVYLLIEGWIFHYSLLSDGRRQILDFALPGTVLGFDSGVEAAKSYSAQALTDAVVCAIPRNALLPLSRRYPEVGLRLASLISQQRNLSFAHLTSIGQQTARERVAHLILELFVRFRSRWPGHHVEEMYLPLTQEHIGDATGLTGVHVNRVLHDLRRDRILQFRYRHLSILDPDRLMDEAGIDPDVLSVWIRRGDFAEGAGVRKRNGVFSKSHPGSGRTWFGGNMPSRDECHCNIPTAAPRLNMVKAEGEKRPQSRRAYFYNSM